MQIQNLSNELSVLPAVSYVTHCIHVALIKANHRASRVGKCNHTIFKEKLKYLRQALMFIADITYSLTDYLILAADFISQR